MKNSIKDKDINKEESLDRLIYGMEVNRVSNKGRLKTFIFFVSHSDNKILEYLPKGTKTLNHIDLSKITEVNFGKKRGNFSIIDAKTSIKFKEELCLSFFSNAESFDLVFSTAEELNQFCYAIYVLWLSELQEDANL